MPCDIGLGEGGDYIEFSLCLDCGKVQDSFPITDDQLKEATENWGEEEEEE